jgi:DNA-binding HxlR family transcriptional regulator
MTRRQYGQPCSLACALDQVGERWSLLVVRELSLGPLRFAELARAVGGAPTDVLTKRLRELEQAGIVQRDELDPPASGVAYALTELGRGLERPMIEMARWGLNLQTVADVAGLAPSSLPNAFRTVLRPPSRPRSACAAVVRLTACTSGTAGSRPVAARRAMPTCGSPAARRR